MMRVTATGHLSLPPGSDLASPRVAEPLDSSLLRRSDGSQRAVCSDERDELLAGPVLGLRGVGAAEALGQRASILPIEPSPRVRILVNVGEIKLELPVIEPLYLSLALHDKRRGVRVSEDFALEGNFETLQSMLGAAASTDVRTRCRQALFSLDPFYSSTRDLVLVLRICKQL